MGDMVKKDYQVQNEQGTLNVAEGVADYGLQVPDALLGIWQMVQGLSVSHRQWLVEHLIVPTSNTSSKIISDEELDYKLSGLPSWNDSSRVDLDILTKEDYIFAMRHSSRKAMKGIEKWL